MTLTDSLPPGEWITNRHGIRRFRATPNIDKLRLLQERTILKIILATRSREREALDQLVQIASRKRNRKAA
jgi:hypothetical protein